MNKSNRMPGDDAYVDLFVWRALLRDVDNPQNVTKDRLLELLSIEGMSGAGIGLGELSETLKKFRHKEMRSRAYLVNRVLPEVLEKIGKQMVKSGELDVDDSVGPSNEQREGAQT
jgi:hypothetical protein